MQISSNILLQEMSVEKISDKDKENCKCIAESLSEIVRFSLDEEFRKKTFEICGVFSSKEIETTVYKKLLSIIQSETEKPAKKSNIKKPRVSNTERHDSEEVICETNQDVSKENNPTEVFKLNILKRTFEGTHEKHLENNMGKRMCYSQPVLSHTETIADSLSNEKADFPHTSSQILFGSSAFQNLSLETYVGHKSYYKFSFEETLKNNANAYSKNNLKLKKPLSL